LFAGLFECLASAQRGQGYGSWLVRLDSCLAGPPITPVPSTGDQLQPSVTGTLAGLAAWVMADMLGDWRWWNERIRSCVAGKT